MEIGLGTAQLGLPYGNRAGAPLISEAEAFAIVDCALSGGIRFFDTASAYGESEERLGRYGLGRIPVEVSTKIPPAPIDTWTDQSKFSAFLNECITRSAARLCVDRLNLLQFHQCDVPFLQNRGVQDAMRRLLEEERCSAIGISVYTREQASAALDIPAIGALQIPLNIVDTRFADAEFVETCRARGIRLIARSILMQGILVPDVALPPVSRAADLARIRSAACGAAADIGRPLRDIALAYIAHLDWLSIALIGADSAYSLQQNLRSLASPEALCASEIDAFRSIRRLAEDANLLNPTGWNAG